MGPEFLRNTEKKLPFNVPEGYFEKLHREITDKVRCGSAASGTVFHVPEGYFDSLPGRIAAQLPGQAAYEPAPGKSGQVPVISAAAGRTAPATWYKTVIAACLALLLGTFGVLQVEKMNQPDNSLMNITNFDEEILVQEYLESWVSAPEEQPGEIETYILNQVDEGLLIQEL